MALNALYVLIGLGLLSAGGELLIRGALGAANRLGVSPLFSGLVIVGFGTSMPELVVSLDALLSGRTDILLGNVVGSNIANILLILGLCAVLAPLAVTPVALWRDSLVVVAASVAFVLACRDGTLARPEAALLLAGLVAYLVWAYASDRQGATASAAMHAGEAGELSSVPATGVVSAVFVVAGLGLLIGGSKALLTGAVALASGFGVSEALIGLTIVAVGTSLPELTVSVLATVRGHGDVAIGNVLGSNIFNLLGILGVSGLMQPLAAGGRIAAFDQWVMLAVAAGLWLVLRTGRRLSRLEGGALLAAMVLYVGIGAWSLG